MEDIEAVKLGLKSKNIKQQIASLSQLIKYRLPIIGYLSPKEYLDFLNLQILDFLSLKPIWSCGVAASGDEM